MHRSLAILVLVSAVALLGMGDLGGAGDEIPEPDEYFAGKIVDRDMVEAQAHYLACDGQTFLKALRGKAIVSIPFARIRSAEFSDGEDGYQNAKVTLHDGTVHEVQVKNIVKCTGKTDIGGMMIRIKDVYKVEFDPQAEKPIVKED